ncbi:amidohydrolase [Clostridioides difficile]|nr:amidohydrolase [Clostridioides difficile]MCI0946105.1 M20 family metallopeptidase [Clostridioides difficile]MDI6219664.1 M20 family metallopeptidase [Clostridioides difficile]MDN9159141.1 amidohydrolase [Clostridioides difficile]HBG2137954.1 amidohydrolase [Clostridioides difficile]
MHELILISEKYKEDILDFFTDIHMHPELSFKEFRTTKAIKDLLVSLDIEILDLGMETGVVGLLKGKYDGPTVALRGDIDALPIYEEVDIEYKSRYDGIMHACGHDIHTSCLVGCAYVLSHIRDSLHGNVKFIFQPAEEVNKGAKMLVERGVMENPKVDAIFGLHNHPDIPCGKIGVKLGGLMAAVDTIKIEVNGFGGHGGIPNRTIDPIVASSAIIMGIQTIVSRNISPLESAVISIGTINGGTANNVISEKVDMTGTCRSFSNEVQKKISENLENIVCEIARGYQATAKLDYLFDLPAVINSKEMYTIACKSVCDLYSEDAIVDPIPSTGGEDFSIFMEKAPGFFYWLGVGNKEQDCIYQWHNPKFKADKNSILVGTNVLCQSVINYMDKLKNKI